MQRLGPDPTTAFHTAVAAVLLLLGSELPAVAQEVYRSVDAQGQVVYSDRGTTKNAPKTALHVEEGDAAEAARLVKQQQALNAQDAQRAKQQAADQKVRDAADRKREEACKSARTEYYRVMDARRLYQRDGDGNRAYYSDDEADAMREKAKKTMDAACAY
jgi:Domain of unknown function (DUF4124)